MKCKILLSIISIILVINSGCIQEKSDNHQLFDNNILIKGKESYSTIQEAINHSTDGDTILISKGIYYENIHLNKTIVLKGENQQTTIINGMNNSTICEISADDVTILNLSFRNSGKEPYDSGILLRCNRTHINNLTFSNTTNGLFLSKESSYNIISNCTLYHNQNGIYLKETTNNHIYLNNISNNSGFGIYLDFYANLNQLNQNIIYLNEVGIRIKTAAYNQIFDNWIMNNTLKGIYLCCSAQNNRLYRNYLIENGVNAQDTYRNYWSSYDHIGNYWSEYVQKYPNAIDEDQDGIWDTPYEIPDEDNKDQYPLVNFLKPHQFIE